MHKVLQFPHLYSPIHSDRKSQPQTECDQNEQVSANLENKIGCKKQKDSSQSEKSKIKTSLCKNFTKTGYCPYGTKCQFAHGPEELRCNMVINTSYKTKYCHAFLKKNVCVFGHRCNFIHAYPANEQTEKNIQKGIYDNYRQCIHQLSIRKESRLMKLLRQQYLN